MKINKLDISIIIPLLNEEESLNELYHQIIDSLKRNNLKEYEIIFVNDGSTDNSIQILNSLREKDNRVKIISFRRNLGKAAALNQGFKKATGKVVVTMDADLQDGPENLFKLLEKLDQGFDLVIGWKKERHDPVSKTMPSKAFNFLERKLSHLQLHDFNSGFRAMKIQVAKELRLYGQLHRFIPVLAYQRGFKVTETPVIHHERKYGQTKYGWGGRIKGLLDLITVAYLGVYGKSPLHLFGIFGFLSIFLGVIFGAYLSTLHFQGHSISQRPLLILSVLLIVAGCQLLSTGLIAEMIVNHHPLETDPPTDYETL